MQKTIITKMSDEEYFGIKGMVNASTLKQLYRKSPKHYQASLDFPEPDPRVFVTGSAIHCMVLEGDEFKDRYCVMPEFEPTEVDKKTGEVKPKTAGWKNTKDYKQQKAIWCTKNKDKIALEPEEMEMTTNIAHAVVRSPYYPLIRDNATEVTILSHIRGVDSKAKVDLLIDHGDEIMIVDLKTTQDASETAFTKSVFNYDYDLQAAWYKESLLGIPGNEHKNIRFAFLAVEKNPPFSVCFYEATDEVLQNGRAKCSKALANYKSWEALGDAVGYPAEEAIVGIKVPSWGRA